MIDDTRGIASASNGETNTHSRPCLATNVKEILKSGVPRVQTARWANSLRFLTFDDGDDSKASMGASPITEHESSQPIALMGQCRPCEERLPLPSGHACSIKSTWSFAQGIKDREAELAKYDNPCMHVLERSCEKCHSIPLFPNHEPVTRFRVRRLNILDGENNNCVHFVAVSYCWSSDDRTQLGEPYKVTDEDGNVRGARAPNATIDRAVAFARENGFRMIWIDQECINQADPVEKEIAIQAMDNVYLRAQASIGLLHAQLEQRHLKSLVLVTNDCFAKKDHVRGPLRRTRGQRISTEDVLEAVTSIVSDRWNSRAWVLQESLASSGDMLLLFPRPEAAEVGSSLLFCQESSRSELAIHLDAMILLLQIVSPLALAKLEEASIKKSSRSSRSAGRTARSSPRGGSPQVEELRKLCKAIDVFHLQRPSSTMSVWVNTLKPRRTCNAATALRFLQSRNLERPADKLAIVANMCDYRTRLNSTELDKTQHSLATCVLALSIINGDLSLLIPDLHSPATGQTIFFPQDVDAEFSWVHSNATSLRQLLATSHNPGGLTAVRNVTTPIRLDENGLSIPGLLWHVDQFLDMKALQVKYRDSWHRLRKEKKRTVPPATTLYRATTHILFEIIAHLVRVGEKAVANAILNSTSDWTWRNTNSKTGAGMVESVDQFPPELRVENRKGMFSLDSSRKDGLGRNRDVEYRQCWIVDRVMEKGGFWIGSIVTDDFNPLDGANFHGPGGGKWIDGFSTDASSELVEAVANETIANETIAGELKPFEGDATDVPMTKASNLVQSQAILPESPLQVETKGRPMERIDYKSHSHRLTVTSMIEMLAGETIFRDSAPGHRITSESMGALAMGLSAPEDMTGRKAVFDLEPFKGNETLVITPYQRALESIPRPAMRSMSVSWVVEPSDGETQRQSMARFRVKAMVKGMWQFTTTFLGTYVLQ